MDSKNQPPLVLLSLNLLAVLFGFGCKAETDSTVAQSTAGRPPNIIFVYVDNLGYGDIEPFGATTIRTPNLNRMAVEGRKFTHFCVTAGVCTPSRASAMTGCYAQRVGM
ncbi:MAG: sulfatase-like hydrolase/transferase, partial [Verrucomicrobiae bacterium]|nr:sulfatase-like hydrolase/transferase [Verrucomicrobiae bacterium]